MYKKPWKTLISRQGKALGAVFMAVLIIGFIGCKPKEQEIINLKFSTYMLEQEPPTVQAYHTLDAVEKEFNGIVKVERHVAGALGGPKEQLDLVKSGSVDIITLHIDQYPQDLPLHQITNTEQLVTGKQGVENIIELMEEIKETRKIFEAEQEKNNIKILYFHCNGPTGITPRFPVKSLADMKGKKVNVIAAYQRDVFKELGWIPVNVAIPELYEGLSRGVIDAIFMATAANLPFKWNEIGKTHLVLGDNTMISAPLAFNLDTWNRLPKDVQKAFMKASRETAEWSVQDNDNFVKVNYEAFEKQGKPVITVSKEERDNFFNVLFKYQAEYNKKIAQAAGVEKEASIIQSYWDKMRWGKK